jgi:diguanylate cyclase (GGDEF)-like protein/PAS domain S-box-containing protein
LTAEPKAARRGRFASRPLKTWAWIFVIVICSAILTIEFGREWSARDSAVAEVETNLSNLAKSLAQHADDTLEMADLVLGGLVAALEGDGTSPLALDRVKRMMATGLATSPRLRALFVYDAAGRWLATSVDNLPPDANNSDRAYFQYHRQSTDKRAYIAPPVISRSGGQWIVTVTRRFDDAEGRFAGVVLASIDSTYFADFYSTFEVGRHGSIGLIGANGQVLSRSPFDGRDVGRDVSSSQIFTVLRTNPGGAYHYVSAIDRVPRIAGYQRASRYGVISLAAVSRDEGLAGWRADAWRRGLATVVLILVVGLLGFRLADQIGRRQKAEAEVARREAEFRAMAEGAGDMVSRIGTDGLRRYVSPAAFRLLGIRAEELVGRSAFDIVDPADMGPIQEAAARLRAGTTTEETLTFRTTHRDGRRLWLESSLRVAGRGEGIVSVTRDVTERKTLEAKLSQMARTDALTGLTNRRAFDEILLVETGRAMRSDAPLSPVLIDLDRFKQFNDTYGHPAGDGCLRAVATLLMAAAKRPGDVAARLGGEELGLLLPETDNAGALIVAERLRWELQGAGMPHLANVPWQVVTASMGVATMTGAGEADVQEAMAALMAAADQALYAAKSGGRNRVMPGEPAGRA